MMKFATTIEFSDGNIYEHVGALPVVESTEEEVIIIDKESNVIASFGLDGITKITLEISR